MLFLLDTCVSFSAVGTTSQGTAGSLFKDTCREIVISAMVDKSRSVGRLKSLRDKVSSDDGSGTDGNDDDVNDEKDVIRRQTPGTSLFGKDESPSMRPAASYAVLLMGKSLAFGLDSIVKQRKAANDDVESAQVVDSPSDTAPSLAPVLDMAPVSTNLDETAKTEKEEEEEGGVKTTIDNTHVNIVDDKQNDPGDDNNDDDDDDDDETSGGTVMFKIVHDSEDDPEDSKEITPAVLPSSTSQTVTGQDQAGSATSGDVAAVMEKKTEPVEQPAADIESKDEEAPVVPEESSTGNSTKAQSSSQEQLEALKKFLANMPKQPASGTEGATSGSDSKDNGLWLNGYGKPLEVIETV